jgi:predicted acylesterase/phospholipase RssA
VHASCALPGFFQPVRVDGRWSVDGGVRDRPALLGMRSSERVLVHHLVDKGTIRRGELPERAHSVTRVLAFEHMPRPHPFALDVGVRAYDEAARRTVAALDA